MAQPLFLLLVISVALIPKSLLLNLKLGLILILALTLFLIQLLTLLIIVIIPLTLLLSLSLVLFLYLFLFLALILPLISIIALIIIPNPLPHHILLHFLGAVHLLLIDLHPHLQLRRFSSFHLQLIDDKFLTITVLLHHQHQNLSKVYVSTVLNHFSYQTINLLLFVTFTL